MKMKSMVNFAHVAREVSEKWRKERGVFPNAAYWSEAEKVLGLYYTVSKKGKDYAVSVQGLHHAVKSQEDGHCSQSYAVFVKGEDPKGEVVGTFTAKQLLSTLVGFPPTEGKIGQGPYWWVDKDFKPVGKPVEKSPIDLPF